jgi:hypothetical protein
MLRSGEDKNFYVSDHIQTTPRDLAAFYTMGAMGCFLDVN